MSDVTGLVTLLRTESNGQKASWWSCCDEDGAAKGCKTGRGYQVLKQIDGGRFGSFKVWLNGDSLHRCGPYQSSNLSDSAN